MRQCIVHAAHSMVHRSGGCGAARAAWTMVCTVPLKMIEHIRFRFMESWALRRADNATDIGVVPSSGMCHAGADSHPVVGIVAPLCHLEFCIVLVVHRQSVETQLGETREIPWRTLQIYDYMFSILIEK